jgi:ribosomal protein S18 acetylase RimI-like enzyme
VPVLRPATDDDLPFLERMLLEAFFWDARAPRPPLDEARAIPDFAKLLAGWGRRGDRAIIAEREAPIAAAWYRLWTPDDCSYGFVDTATPELAIAVAPGDRARGLGRALLRALIADARAQGHPGLSLSVAPANVARRLYESEGFTRIGEVGTSWTLACSFAR